MILTRRHPLVKLVWERQQMIWDKWADKILEVLKEYNINPKERRFRKQLHLTTRFINGQERLVRIFYGGRLLWRGCL